MLDEAKGKVAENIFAQVLQEVLETTVKAKEIAEDAKTKFAQLTVPEKKKAGGVSD